MINHLQVELGRKRLKSLIVTLAVLSHDSLGNLTKTKLRNETNIGAVELARGLQSVLKLIIKEDPVK